MMQAETNDSVKVSDKPILTYRANLWDRFNEIVTRMTAGKESVKQLQAMFKLQNDVQVYLAKNFIKQKLTSDKTVYGLATPMATLNMFVVKTGEKHSYVANDLNTNLYKEITNMRKELSKSIKDAIKEDKKLRSDLNSAISAVKAAKQKDMNDKKNYEKHQINQLKAPSDLPPKKRAALEKAVTDADNYAKKSEQDYKTSVEKLHAMDKKYYEKLGDLMARLEVLDRKRINVVKSIIERYAALQADLAQTMKDHCDSMKESFRKIDAEDDIQSFIRETQSGQVPAPPSEFEPYIATLPDEYQSQLQTTRLSIKPSSNNLTQSVPTPTTTSPMVKDASANSDITFTKPPTPVVNDIISTKTTTATNSTSTTASKPVKRVRAAYDYTAENDEELNLKEGDLIDVYEINQDSWWLGEVSGRRGYFPSNFAAELDDVSANNSVPAAAPASTVATALYEYTATDENELSFPEGSVIDVSEMRDDGWWYGTLRGTAQAGLFPSNYVKTD